MKIEATLNNVCTALEDFAVCGAKLAVRDSNGLMVIRFSFSGEYRDFKDGDYIQLRLNLERNGFVPVGRRRIKECVRHIALQTTFNDENKPS